MLKFLPGETYEERVIRQEAENAARMTDPPTQPIHSWDSGEDYEQIDYPEDTLVRWVCPCGGQLDCFYEEGAYRTFAKCQVCGLTADIHTG